MKDMFQTHMTAITMELSIIRLLGFSTRSIVLFPITQAVLIAALGAVAALAIYFAVSLLLNSIFASSLRSGELICRLLPLHFLLAVLMTLVCAVLAASWAGYRAALIEPAEGIRDV
jgi:putative ABC transport system permease protein